MQRKQKKVSSVEHALLGWHRAVSSDTRIQGWLKRREKALYDALKTVPGRKDVIQYMKDAGWLDLGPQLTPVKTKPLKISQLKHYQPVTLFITHRKTPDQDQMYIFGLGLVDYKLQVRPLRVQSPLMRPAYSTPQPYPKCLRFCDREQDVVWSTQLQRLYLSAGTSMRSRLEDYSDPDMPHIAPDGINARPNPKEYPRYDFKGKRITRSATLSQRTPVRAIMIHSNLIAFGYSDPICLDVYGKFEIQQLKVDEPLSPCMDHPLFINDSDDEY